MGTSWRMKQTPTRISVVVSQERYQRILADLGKSLYPYLASSPQQSSPSIESPISSSPESGRGKGDSQ